MEYADNYLTGLKIIYLIETNECSLEPLILAQKEYWPEFRKALSLAFTVFDLFERYYRITAKYCKTVCRRHVACVYNLKHS